MYIRILVKENGFTDQEAPHYLFVARATCGRQFYGLRGFVDQLTNCNSIYDTIRTIQTKLNENLLHKIST